MRAIMNIRMNSSEISFLYSQAYVKFESA